MTFFVKNSKDMLNKEQDKNILEKHSDLFACWLQSNFYLLHSACTSEGEDIASLFQNLAARNPCAAFDKISIIHLKPFIFYVRYICHCILSTSVTLICKSVVKARTCRHHLGRTHAPADDALKHTALADALSADDTNLWQLEAEVDLALEAGVLQPVDHLHQLLHRLVAASFTHDDLPKETGARKYPYCHALDVYTEGTRNYLLGKCNRLAKAYKRGSHFNIDKLI